MIRCAKPAPALRQFIRYYHQFEACLVDATALQPVPARSPQAIEFTFGTPYEVHRLDRGQVETAHRIAVIGAQTFRRVELVMHGKVEAFVVVFQPAGMHRLFSVPPEKLTNDHFEGEAALDRTLGELERRLGDAGSFAQRVRAADDYFWRKRPALDSVGGIASTANVVLLSRGCVRVSDLANDLGLGVRQFERRFMYEIGIPPKLYARIARFEAALRCKAAAPSSRWTEIAHELGYHDQMHMVHDFNQLSGNSPNTISSQLDMFVQPEIVLGAQPQSLI